jgi:hypothetical protein
VVDELNDTGGEASDTRVDAACEIGRWLQVAGAYVHKSGANFIGWEDVGGIYVTTSRTLAPQNPRSRTTRRPSLKIVSRLEGFGIT